MYLLLLLSIFLASCRSEPTRFAIRTSDEGNSYNETFRPGYQPVNKAAQDQSAQKPIRLFSYETPEDLKIEKTSISKEQQYAYGNSQQKANLNQEQQSAPVEKKKILPLEQPIQESANKPTIEKKVAINKNQTCRVQFGVFSTAANAEKYKSNLKQMLIGYEYELETIVDQSKIKVVTEKLTKADCANAKRVAVEKGVECFLLND